MPDLDIVGKGIPSCFHRSYRLIRGGADEEHVLYACRRGLPLALQRGAGIPSLAARAALISAVGGGGSVGDAISRSRQLIVADGGTRHAQLAHRALERLLAHGESPSSMADCELLLAEYFCHELLEHFLLSRVSIERQELGQTDREFETYRRRLHSGLAQTVGALASQLVTDPSGASIQTPPSRRPPRPSTDALLAQVVG